MREAVIVSTARTPIGKAYRGAFNNTHGAAMGGHVVKHAVERAGLAPEEVDDVIMGCAMPERATGQNIARLCAIRAGLPVTVSGMTVNRFCSSGLQTIALAAQRVMSGEADAIVAGGLESCSLVQDAPRAPVYEDWLKEHKPEMWMSMIETADIVAARYGVSREKQDAYALESQRRTASAQQAREFDVAAIQFGCGGLIAIDQIGLDIELHTAQPGIGRRRAIVGYVSAYACRGGGLLRRQYHARIAIDTPDFDPRAGGRLYEPLQLHRIRHGAMGNRHGDEERLDAMRPCLCQCRIAALLPVGGFPDPGGASGDLPHGGDQLQCVNIHFRFVAGAGDRKRPPFFPLKTGIRQGKCHRLQGRSGIELS